MPKAVIRVWVLIDESEMGLWCDHCHTSAGIRIPVLTLNGVSEIRTCLTCKHRTT